MTQRVWPTSVALEPDARVLPAPLAATLAAAGGTAPVTLLVAGKGAIESGWAPRAAVALAEAWSRDGTRLVLADLSLGAAGLDQLVGEPNDEGLADVFFYGASLKRVIRASSTRGFGFIPAGSAPVDARDLLTDAGWRQVIAYFFREGSALLVYVPASAEGLAELAARLGAVIALAAPGDVEELEAELPAEAALLAAIAPPAPAPPPPVKEPAAVPVEPVAVPVAPAVPPAEQAVAPADAVTVTMPVAGPPPEPAAPVSPEEARFAPPWAGVAPPVPETPVEPAAAPPEEESRWAPPTPEAEGAVVHGLEPVEATPAEPEPAGAGAEARAAQAEEREARKQRPRIPDDPREALVEALWARRAGGPGRPGLAPPVDLVPGRKVTERELLAEPPTLLPEAAPRRAWLSTILWLVLGAAVIVGAVFAWQAYRNGQLAIPGVQRLTTRARPAVPTTSAAAPATTSAAAPVAAPADSLPYSVAIEAYPEYRQAVARAAALGREQADVSFFVTPMLDRGVIYYHVMAGPVPDSVEAATLMQRLLDAGVKTGASQWDIIPTRLAFDLGDFPSRSEAEQRGAAMAQKSIPTYVVEVPAPGGATAWRLYAGAFQGVADAAVLRPVLKGAGVPDSLVLRIGRAPR